MATKKNKSQQTTGLVEWFDSFKGIGYIRTEDGNLIMVTYKDLPIRNGDFVVIRKGQKVMFNIQTGIRGPEAKDIKIIQ
jgi:cold shock CspA family protein